MERLAIVPSVGPEAAPIEGKDLATHGGVRDHDQRRIGVVHRYLPIAPHQSRRMLVSRALQRDDGDLGGQEEVERDIGGTATPADEVSGLGEDRFGGETAVANFIPLSEALRVPLVAAIEESHHRAGVDENVPLDRHLSLASCAAGSCPQWDRHFPPRAAG